MGTNPTGGATIMAYAKKCKYCNTVQVVWNDKLDGPNKFMEVETNLQHSRDRCDAAKGQKEIGRYSPQQEKEFVDTYRPIQVTQEQITDTQLAQLITKVDNLNIGLAKVMSMIQTLNDLSMNAEDISRLRTENAELKDVLKNREDNFVPANQVPSQIQQDFENNPEAGEALLRGMDMANPDKQHVQNMVQKGKDEEEMEI